MEKIMPLKLEKKTISEQESLELAPRLFEPIGQETVKSMGRVEIENENLRISMRYEDIKFDIDEIPRTEEEMEGTRLSADDRHLIRFLDFKPEDFYELRYFLMENKNSPDQIELEEYDSRKIRIFVLKNGHDISGASAHGLKDYVRLKAEPKTAAGLLMAFHEIGHKKDPKISILDSFSQRTPENKETEDQKMIDRERYAWAYSLSKLKPFFPGMNIDQKDLDTFIHKFCLGTYSDFIRNSD